MASSDFSAGISLYVVTLNSFLMPLKYAEQHAGDLFSAAVWRSIYSFTSSWIFRGPVADRSAPVRGGLRKAATVITVLLYCYFQCVRASGQFPRILAKLFHDLLDLEGVYSQTSTHFPPTSAAMRSGAMRTAALVAPAAGTTSSKGRSEASQ